MMNIDQRTFGSPRVARVSRQGTAIVPALVLVVIVSTLSMILVQQSLAKNKEQRMSVDTKRAFYMAEAGIAEGFAGLNIGKSGNVGSENEPAQFANGLFFTVATEEGGGLVTLKSTGLCGAGRATLSQVVQREADGPSTGALGFFASQSITVKQGALVDSYNSRKGPYVAFAGVPGSAGEPVASRLGCNGNITTTGTKTWKTVIYGDAQPGPAGTVIRSAYDYVSGSTAPGLAAVALPAVAAPPVTVAGSLDAAVAGGTLKSVPGVQGLAAISVRTSSALVLVGPAVIVTRALTLAPGAALKFDTSAGPVKLYVMGSMSVDPTSTIATSTTDPFDVSLEIGAPGLLPLEAKTQFHGTIYAPNADVEIGQNFEVFGAVTAQSLLIASSGKLHFDEALSGADGISGPNPDGTPRIMGWRIVDLPKVAVVSLRYDALKALKDSGITPLPSKDAHVDIGVTPP